MVVDAVVVKAPRRAVQVHAALRSCRLLPLGGVACLSVKAPKLLLGVRVAIVGDAPLSELLHAKVLAHGRKGRRWCGGSRRC